jgi:molybdate transport system substrate-binding protein
MKFRYLFFIIPFTSLFLISNVGCSSGQVEEQNGAELSIAAASDLNLAFREIGERFEEKTGSTLTFSFGSTGQLAVQIENGAPFDVFAAANVEFVDDLREKGLIIPDTQTTYAFGRIGIATLPDRALSVEKLEDLLKPEVRKIAIANPAHAPYGLAAKQAFETAFIMGPIGKPIMESYGFVVPEGK